MCDSYNERLNAMARSYRCPLEGVLAQKWAFACLLVLTLTWNYVDVLFVAMIDYEFGSWGIGFLCKLRGSVFPKALVWALPNAIFVLLLKLLMAMAGNFDDRVRQFILVFRVTGNTFISVWGGYTMVLGFLLVFRTQIAYSRFWEGCTVLTGVRGVWFNATSNLVAFSTDSIELRGEVLKFQHLLVRLMSMLFCAAIQQVADMEEEDFEILGEDGINEENLEYLAISQDKCEVILQWVQKLIVKSHYNDVLPIAPPILSRVFQELSNGIVDLQGARKIGEFPFPFPYAQTISLFLLLHYVVTPIVAAFIIENWIFGIVAAFATVFAFWSVNYIAAEIEMPFGDDPNDLPLSQLQVNFNRSLRMLMDPMAQHAPEFDYNPSMHNELVPSPTKYLVDSYVSGEISNDDGTQSNGLAGGKKEKTSVKQAHTRKSTLYRHCDSNREKEEKRRAAARRINAENETQDGATPKIVGSLSGISAIVEDDPKIVHRPEILSRVSHIDPQFKMRPPMHMSYGRGSPTAGASKDNGVRIPPVLTSQRFLPAHMIIQYDDSSSQGHSATLSGKVHLERNYDETESLIFEHQDHSVLHEPSPGVFSHSADRAREPSTGTGSTVDVRTDVNGSFSRWGSTDHWGIAPAPSDTQASYDVPVLTVSAAAGAAAIPRIGGQRENSDTHIELGTSMVAQGETSMVLQDAAAIPRIGGQARL